MTLNNEEQQLENTDNEVILNMNNEKSIETENDDYIEENEDEIVLDVSQYPAAIEALLFSMGESVEISSLADAAGISENDVLETLDILDKKYKKIQSGIMLLRLENSVQLVTKKEYYGVLKKLVKLPKQHRLSDTMLETLSIVAYKQPVTRNEIEKIRGVASDRQINKLIEYDFIKELGRLDAPGKPILFGTTEQFLKSFGVSSIEELPQASADRIADFEAEAEEEVQNIKI